MHEPNGIANREIRTGRRSRLGEVEGDDGEPQRDAGAVQPGAADVRDGEVQQRQDEGAKERVGDDEGLEGAYLELVREVEPVEIADVGAEVGKVGGRGGEGDACGEGVRCRWPHCVDVYGVFLVL